MRAFVCVCFVRFVCTRISFGFQIGVGAFLETELLMFAVSYRS